MKYKPFKIIFLTNFHRDKTGEHYGGMWNNRLSKENDIEYILKSEYDKIEKRLQKLEKEKQKESQ